MKKKSAYRAIRRNLSEKEARNLLAQAYSQRQNCIEEIFTIKHIGIDPLICALCKQTPQQMVESAKAQIEWIDKRIEDLQRFLPQKVKCYDLLG